MDHDAQVLAAYEDDLAHEPQLNALLSALRHPSAGPAISPEAEAELRMLLGHPGDRFRDE